MGVKKFNVCVEGSFKWVFKEGLRVLQGRLRGVPRKLFLGSFKGV